MSNAAAITVNDLTANGATNIVDPTPDTLDTGTAAVTLYAAVGGRADDVIFRIKNTDDDTAMTVAILAGDNPPAQRAGVGNASQSVAFGATRWFGPFEGSRFLQDDGSIGITVTPASGIISAQITCFRIPRTV